MVDNSGTVTGYGIRQVTSFQENRSAMWWEKSLPKNHVRRGWQGLFGVDLKVGGEAHEAFTTASFRT